MAKQKKARHTALIKRKQLELENSGVGADMALEMAKKEIEEEAGAAYRAREEAILLKIRKQEQRLADKERQRETPWKMLYQPTSTDDALVAMATTADAAMEYILGGGWKGVWGFSAARGEWVRFDWICPR